MAAVQKIKLVGKKKIKTVYGQYLNFSPLVKYENIQIRDHTVVQGVFFSLVPPLTIPSTEKLI